MYCYIYVPRFLEICAIYRMRNAIQESLECVPIYRLARNLQNAQRYISCAIYRLEKSSKLSRILFRVVAMEDYRETLLNYIPQLRDVLHGLVKKKNCYSDPVRLWSICTSKCSRPEGMQSLPLHHLAIIFIIAIASACTVT